MNKTLSVFIAVLMVLSCMTVFVSADGSDLPYKLVAPGNVTVNWLEEDDSPTTMALSYTLSNEMTRFYEEKENASLEERTDEFMSEFDFYDIWMFVQIDWALDDVNDEVSGWHYTKYWDGNKEGAIGYDDDWNIRVSEWDGADIGLNNATETTQTTWVMRCTPNDERWNGNPDTKTPGVKDQLRPEQYTYDNEIDSVRIDFTEHTAYFRARFVTVTRKETEDGDKDTLYFSEWSNVASEGKNAEVYAPLTAKDLPAPDIKGLHMKEEKFNGAPVAAFTLTVPEELMENNAKVTAHGGGIFIETYARVKGDAEWTEMQNVDWTISAGERDCALIHLISEARPEIPDDVSIELRCRYRCYQPDMNDVYSEYSKVITFLLGDMNEDGKINNKDVVTLFRAISGTNVVYYGLYDFNGDKKLNNKDVVSLFRYINK